MSQLITVTRIATPNEKGLFNFGNHLIEQNGTPNFVPTSQFAYRNFDSPFPDDFLKNHSHISRPRTQMNISQTKSPPLHNSTRESNDNSETDNFESILNESNDEFSTNESFENTQIKPRAQTALPRSRNLSNAIRRNSSIKTNDLEVHPEQKKYKNSFKNILNSHERTFKNAQRIRVRKMIQLFEKEEKYKQQIANYEQSQTLIRYLPTKNIQVTDSTISVPVTNTQRSLENIPYYYPPTKINNTSKFKCLNRLQEADRRIVEAVAEIRKDRINPNSYFES